MSPGWFDQATLPGESVNPEHHDWAAIASAAADETGERLVEFDRTAAFGSAFSPWLGVARSELLADGHDYRRPLLELSRRHLASRLGSVVGPLLLELFEQRSQTYDEFCQSLVDGDWEAVLVRYRAMILDLVDAESVPDIPGRTTGEHRRDVVFSRPEMGVDFAEAATIFEDMWYGDGVASADRSAEFRSLSDSVVAGADA